jgi:hypothetical protein
MGFFSLSMGFFLMLEEENPKVLEVFTMILLWVLFHLIKAHLKHCLFVL